MITMFSAYIFWFILTRITTPEIIGISSTIVSISIIFITLSMMGVPTGVQRFLGLSFSKQDHGNSSMLLKSSLILIIVGIVGSSVAILIEKDWIEQTFRIDISLLFIIILIVSSTAISTLFRSIIIASLETKTLPIITMISSGVKILLAVLLIKIGAGVIGVTIGFSFYPILVSIFLSIFIIRSFKPYHDKPEFSLRYSLRTVLVASIPNWIPNVIYTIGLHLGTLVVFGVKGANQAGVYFIALSVVNAIIAITSVLTSIGFPAMSAMSDGRKRFAWKIMKFNLMIAMPLTCLLIFYSKEIMQLFGHDYIQGSPSLEILLLSVMPFAIANGIITLGYSYGHYRQILMFGLASNVPRLVLYFILVPHYSSIGAAFSFSAGTIIGFVISVIYAKIIKMKIFWRDVIFISLIPVGIAFILKYFGLNYILVSIITIIFSYCMYLKLKIISRMDVEDVFGIFPTNVRKPLLGILNAIAKKIDRSY